MYGSIGMPELMVLIVVTLILILPAWRIFAKAGFSGWMGVGICIPVVNVGLWFFLAFVEWPLERELRQLKGNPPASGR